MSLWMTEQDMLREEEELVTQGAPPRDLSEYSAWREETPQELLDGMAFYGRYLIGQSSGLSSALSLPAVATAFEIESVPEDEQVEMTQLLIGIHHATVEEAERRERMKGRPRG